MSERMDHFSKQKTLFTELDHLVVPDGQMANLKTGEASYIPEFVTEEEETALLNAIDKEPWLTDLKRRVQHYGYRYDYKNRSISDEDYLGPLPKWARALCHRLVHQEEFFDTPPDQLIVNEYEPGQGIAPHIDRNCFGPVLAALSLGSDCMMQVKPPRDQAHQFDIVLERRSLIVYRGVSRNKWRHGIAARQVDEQGDRKIPRRRRVSLTFRTVRKDTDT